MCQLNGKAESFFEDQMQEAWLHYRHCETLRLQYLVMYLTAFSASVGFVVSLLTKPTAVTPSIVFGIVIVVGVMFLFSILIFVITSRLNIITNFYADVMEYSRQYFFDKGDYASTAWDYSVIGLHPIRAGMFSIAGSLTRLLYFITGCLMATQAFNAVLLSEMLSRHSVRARVALITVVSMVLTSVYVLLASRQVLKKNRGDRQRTKQLMSAD